MSLMVSMPVGVVGVQITCRKPPSQHASGADKDQGTNIEEKGRECKG